MKDNIEEIDQLIKETLSAEESKFYDNLEEQNILQMILGLFKGKNKWIMFLMNLVTLLFFSLFIYCIIQFFNAAETKELIKWATGTLVFLLGVSMLKIFAWLQMNKNALLREIKRLELLIISSQKK